MAKDPAFQLYAADFFVDVAGWDCFEVGVYFRLLMHEWVEGPLPNDHKQLARIAGCSYKKFQKSFGIISKKFSQTEHDFLINKRLENQRQKQSNYRKKQAIHGKKGADIRYKKDGVAHRVAYSDPNRVDIASQFSSSLSSEEDSNRLSEDNQDLKNPGTENFEDKTPKKTSHHFSKKIQTSYVDQLIEIAKAIDAKDGNFNPYQFIQQKANIRGHPEAIIFSLTQLLGMWESVKSPWPWVETVYNKKNGTFNERDTVRAHEKLKQDILNAPAEIKEIIGTMFLN